MWWIKSVAHWRKVNESNICVMKIPFAQWYIMESKLNTTSVVESSLMSSSSDVYNMLFCKATCSLVLNLSSFQHWQKLGSKDILQYICMPHGDKHGIKENKLRLGYHECSGHSSETIYSTDDKLGVSKQWSVVKTKQTIAPIHEFSFTFISS